MLGDRPRWRRVRRRLAPAALLLTVLLAYPAGAAGAPADCSRALQAGTLEPGVGFGGLRLGMSPEEVTRLVGPPERGGDSAAWEYPSCGFAVLFDRDQKEVGGFAAGDGTGGGPALVDAFTVETAEGLGMGSTRYEIVSALGAPTEARSEGTSEVLVYPSRGVSWVLRKGRVEHLTIRRTR